MVETDRAAAFVMDDILLYSLVATSKSPKDYVISADALSVEPYGIMLRREDPAFKKVVDAAMIATYKSGAINAIYDKWFLQADSAQGRQSQRADGRGLQESRRQSDRQRRSGGVLIARACASSPAAWSGVSQRVVGARGGGMNYNWNWGIFWQISPDALP